MEAKRISVLVKFEPSDLERIDAMRGAVPRMTWIVAACMTKAVTPPDQKRVDAAAPKAFRPHPKHGQKIDPTDLADRVAAFNQSRRKP